MKRFLAILLIAPLLLAPVRLKDSTPSFFTPPAQGPAPESYSLPSAAPLITPTVIQVSPTVLDIPSPTQPVTPSLNLPLPPAPATPRPAQSRPQLPIPHGMSAKAAAICMRAMVYVQDMAMLSHREKENQSLINLTLAATQVMAQAQQQEWPDLTMFNKAVAKLPWRYPQKDDLGRAITAGRQYCGNSSR